MSDHLPECDYTGSVHDVCICDELRACEQRMYEWSKSFGVGKKFYDAGRLDALDAAWIAVGNVPCATTTHGDDFRDIPGPIVKRNALAAIDALKERE